MAACTNQEVLQHYWLQLSNRTKNILKANNIIKLKDFMNLTQEMILSLRGAGVLVARDIDAVQCKIQKDNAIDFGIMEELYFPVNGIKTEINSPFVDYEALCFWERRLERHIIQELLPASLKKYITEPIVFKSLWEMVNARVVPMKGLGASKTAKFKEALDVIINEKLEAFVCSLEWQQLADEIAKEFATVVHTEKELDVLRNEIVKFIYRNLSDIKKLTKDGLPLIPFTVEMAKNFIDTQPKDAAEFNFRRLYYKKATETIKKSKDGVTLDEICDIVTLFTITQPQMRKLLISTGVEAETLFSKKGRYYIRPLGMEDWIGTLPDKLRKTVYLRLHGKTLEEVGDTLGLTRERVRQICNKAYEKKPALYEDSYRDLYEKYDISEEAFTFITKEPVATYQYLDGIYRRGKASIESLMEDEAYPEQLRLKAEQYIYRDYVEMEGERFPFKRDSIVSFCVKQYAQEKISFSLFKEKFDWVCKEILKNNPDLVSRKQITDKDLYYPETSLRNKLSAPTYRQVLWNLHESFRFYNVNSADIEELVIKLGLPLYKDVEISTKLLYDEHPNLMKEIDIRDEYELYSLLKKRLPEVTGLVVDLRRMPFITFGTADRKAQLLRVLQRISPTTTDELAQEYSNEFGVDPITVKANLYPLIKEYINGEVVSVCIKDMPQDQLNFLRYRLTSEIYTMEEIQDIYISAFPTGDITLLDNYNLNRIGYKYASSFVFRKEYSGAVNAFSSFFQSQKIIHLNKYFMKAIITSLMAGYVSTLRRKHVVFEIKRDQYGSKAWMEEHGITPQLLEDYISAAIQFSAGKPFSLYSLHLAGFSHGLESIVKKLGLDEICLVNLLRHSERLTHTSFGSAYFFKEGTEQIMQGTLVKMLVEKTGCMSIDEVKNNMKQNYGFDIANDGLIASAIKQNVFYNKVNKTFYTSFKALDNYLKSL